MQKMTMIRLHVTLNALFIIHSFAPGNKKVVSTVKRLVELTYRVNRFYRQVSSETRLPARLNSKAYVTRVRGEHLYNRTYRALYCHDLTSCIACDTSVRSFTSI